MEREIERMGNEERSKEELFKHYLFRGQSIPLNIMNAIDPETRSYWIGYYYGLAGYNHPLWHECHDVVKMGYQDALGDRGALDD